MRFDAPSPPVARWAPPATWAVLAAFAAVAAYFVAGPHGIGDVFTESDFYGAYGPGALALEHGHIDPARYGVVGPVHEFVLALAGFVVRDLFRAAEILSLIAMTAALALWSRIVRERAGALAGLFTALLLATNPQVLRYAYAATTDALALALQAGALALLLTGRPSARRAAAAGAVAGLAFLTRYNAVALLPAGFVMLLAGWTAWQGAARRAGALAFAAGFAAPVLPWVAFSVLSGAHFQFRLHHNIAYEVFAHARGITWDTYERTMEPQFPTPWSVLARDPGAVVARVAFNVLDHLRLDARLVAGWPLAVAAIAGLWLGRRDGALGRLAGAWLATGLLFLTLVPAFHSERYSLAVLPAWAALGALAFTSTRFALPVGARGVWLKPALAILVLVPAARDSSALQRHGLTQLPLEAKEIAAGARSLFRPGDRVYARKPHFAWEAGLTAVSFPFADSLSQLAAAARRDSVRWIYFSWPEAELRPQFAYLLDTTSAVPGLVVRAMGTVHPAVLYEIVPGFGADPAWLAERGQLNVHQARAMLQIDVTDWRARAAASVDAQRRGRWQEAQPWLEQAHLLAPGQTEITLMLADNLLHLRRPVEARPLYLEVQRADPASAAAQIGLGWSALLTGDAAAAAELWRPVIAYAADDSTLRRMAELFSRTHDAAATAAVRDREREIVAAGGVAP